jgi:hypothetical protein
MSYKPERKYIAVIKGMACSAYQDTGGSFFDGNDDTQTATSFEILRDDFGLIGTGTNKRLPEAGTYHLVYTAIMDLAGTTVPENMYIHCTSSNHGYTNPTLSYSAVSSPTLKTYTGALRKYKDTTVNGTICRTVTFDFTVDYNSNQGLSNSLYFNYRDGRTQQVNTYIYQRIEITKI